MISKKRYNLPFWSLTVSFVLGVFLFSAKVVAVSALLIPTLVLFLVLFFFSKWLHSILFTILACLLFIVIGGLRYQLAIPEHQPDHLIHQKDTESISRIVFSVSELFKSTNKWASYQATVKQFNGKQTSGKILLKVKKDTLLTLKKGSSYVSDLKLKKLPNETFPYGFNYTKYLNQQGITHQAWVSETKLIALPKYTNHWADLMADFQQRLSSGLKKQQLSSDVIQFTQALVLGDKKELTKQLKTNFQNAGVIHILAISGLHIGVIYLAFSWVLKTILYRHKFRVVRSVVVLVVLWLFAWFSGASDSALRATTMFSFFEISLWLLRRQHPLNALLLSVFVLVGIDPRMLFSVGFQLSVVAVISIIIGVPKLSKIWEPKLIVVNYLWEIICVSLCAQIGLLPLSLYYFHQFPLLFLVANIPIMCCIPIIMAMAIGMVAGSYFFTWPALITTIYDFVISTLLNFVAWVASVDGLVLKELYISKFTVVAIYLAFVYLRWCYTNLKTAFAYVTLPLAFLVIVGFVEVHQKSVKKEIWLLNDYKNTTIVELFSGGAQVFSESELREIDKHYKIDALVGALHYDTIEYKSLKQAYTLNNKKLLVVNENYLPRLEDSIDILLVSNSPKLNFERLLKVTQPKKVIFTACNKFYHLRDWKMSCKKMNVSYYDVSKHGSVRLDNL